MQTTLTNTFSGGKSLAYPSHLYKAGRDTDTLSAPRERYDIVVFSNVRWDFMHQRPHHIFCRLAQQNKVLYVEEPCMPGDSDSAHVWEASDNITIFQPSVKHIADIEKVLLNFLGGAHIPVGWFYSASFAPLLNAFHFGKIVYDCVDEVSVSMSHSTELKVQEQYLLSEADIVFTSGKSLFEIKYRVHDNVYCFPGSVERKHFEKAKAHLATPADMLAVSGPVIGYHGVVDERINFELVSATAAQCPQFSFVFTGPVTMAADKLPGLPNIYYLGHKPYHQLPAYLKAFDVCMLPFAVNESTRYCCPAAILEYMAAGKPVVSASLQDVVRDYKTCVHFADDPQTMSETITTLLSTAHSYTNRHYADLLDGTSWDYTARRMAQLIIECSPRL